MSGCDGVEKERIKRKGNTEKREGIPLAKTRIRKFSRTMGKEEFNV